MANFSAQVLTSIGHDGRRGRTTSVQQRLSLWPKNLSNKYFTEPQRGCRGFVTYIENKNSLVNFSENFLHLYGWGGRSYYMTRKCHKKFKKKNCYIRVKDIRDVKNSIFNVIKIILFVAIPILFPILLVIREIGRAKPGNLELYESITRSVGYQKNEKALQRHYAKQIKDFDVLPFNEIKGLKKSDPFADKLHYVVMNGGKGIGHLENVNSQEFSVSLLTHFCRKYRLYAPWLIETIIREDVEKRGREGIETARIVKEFLESKDSYYKIPKVMAKKFLKRLARHITRYAEN